MGLFDRTPDTRSKEQIARDYFNNAYQGVKGNHHWEYSMFHAHYVEMDMLDKLHDEIQYLHEEVKALRDEIKQMKE